MATGSRQAIASGSNKGGLRDDDWTTALEIPAEVPEVVMTTGLYRELTSARLIKARPGDSGFCLLKS